MDMHVDRACLNRMDETLDKLHTEKCGLRKLMVIVGPNKFTKGMFGWSFVR